MAAHSSSILAISLVLFAAVAVAQSLSPGMTRVAVVTGANKGIGRAIAEHLACSGIFTDVILGCRDDRRAAAAVNKIESNPNASRSCTVVYHPLTIGDKASHAAFAEFVKTHYLKVDVLVNNAGIAFKNADPTPFEQQCKPTLAVNFWGTVDFTEQMLPLVRKGHDARIVSVASMAGHLGQLRSRELQRMISSPQLTKGELCSLVDKFEADVMNGRHVQEGWGNSNYGFSKLAVVAATKIWAREEAANGIAVNCCCPGYCDTDMTSHRGPRSPWEGAKNAVIPATMENPPTGEYFADFRVARW